MLSGSGIDSSGNHAGGVTADFSDEGSSHGTQSGGRHAAYLNSSLTTAQYYKALGYAREGRYPIIYVAPERLMTETFLDFAMHVDIAMLAIDEAHCISQWGQDFRPSYLKIVDFIEKLPRRPVSVLLRRPRPRRSGTISSTFCSYRIR